MVRPDGAPLKRVPLPPKFPPVPLPQRLGETLNRVSAARDSSTTTIFGLLELDLGGIGQVIAGALTDLYKALQKDLHELTSDIDQAQDTLAANLSTQVSSIAPSLTGALGAVISLLAGGIDSLLANLATVDDTVKIVFKAVRDNADGLKEWLAETGAGALGVGLLGAFTNLEQETPEALDRALEQLAGVEGMPDFLKELIADFQARNRPIWGIVGAALVSIAILPLLGALFTAPRDRTQQLSYELLPVALPGVGEIVQAFQRGTLSPQDYAELLRRSGIGARAQAVLEANLIPRPDPGTLVRALRRGTIDRDLFEFFMGRLGWPEGMPGLIEQATRPVLSDLDLLNGLLRGVIPAAEHDAQLRAQGYTDAEIQWRKALYFFLPPPQDLIRMAVREVFDPGQRAILDLDAEFPPDFGTWASRQGISEVWARNYWAAHWELPSANQGFEMLHRGQINEDELRALLKAQDYAPVWRERLQAIAYSPFTRVDIRRMHRVGVLSEAELPGAYQQIGYTPENAERLARFTVELNREEHALAVEPFRVSLKGRIVSAFIGGLISGQETATALGALGYSPAETDAFLAEAQFVQAFEQAEAIRAVLRREYVEGLITWESAVAQLGQLGFGAEEIGTLEPLWRELREHRELSESEIQARDLTKAEVLRAYRESILTLEEADAQLTALGYDDRERSVLVALEDVKAQNELANALRDAIKSRFLRGLISEHDAGLQLDQIGVAPAHREALLARWTSDKIKAGKEVPPSTIRDLLKAKAITPARALELLSGQGWPVDVNRAVIGLWQQGSKAGSGA